MGGVGEGTEPGEGADLLSINLELNYRPLRNADVVAFKVKVHALVGCECPSVGIKLQYVGGVHFYESIHPSRRDRGPSRIRTKEEGTIAECMTRFIHHVQANRRYWICCTAVSGNVGQD